MILFHINPQCTSTLSLYYNQAAKLLTDLIPYNELTICCYILTFTGYDNYNLQVHPSILTTHLIFEMNITYIKICR